MQNIKKHLPLIAGFAAGAVLISCGKYASTMTEGFFGPMGQQEYREIYDSKLTSQIPKCEGMLMKAGPCLTAISETERLVGYLGAENARRMEHNQPQLTRDEFIQDTREKYADCAAEKKSAAFSRGVHGSSKSELLSEIENTQSQCIKQAVTEMIDETVVKASFMASAVVKTGEET
jgi:hypothetical protein